MTTTLRVGLVQLTTGQDIGLNIERAVAGIRAAHAQGAAFVLTPEATSIYTDDKEFARKNVRVEAEDPALPVLAALAAELKIWLLIGSLGIKGDGEKRWNRSFLIGPDGAIVARYNKIHLFDVELGEGRSYRESNSYQGGDHGTLVDSPWGPIGLTICYDLRFPQLYRAYAKAGARIITVPAAFTKWTGEAHWHVLLRARAIETGAFILAPGQVGDHGGGRETYGHSLVIDPWGRILADGGDAPGVVVADLDLAMVDEVRGKIPSLNHDVDFSMTKAAVESGQKVVA